MNCHFLKKLFNNATSKSKCISNPMACTTLVEGVTQHLYYQWWCSLPLDLKKAQKNVQVYNSA